MSPAVAWLIAEIIKLTVQRIMDAGKFDSLTQEEAEAMIPTLTGELSTNLPSPEELEKGN